LQRSPDSLDPSSLDLLAGPHRSGLGLLRTRPDTLTKMFEGFRGGFFALLPLNADALPAVAALMKRYESAGLQLADAALAYLAERENIRTVFTIDRRDFSIIRLKRNRMLRIIPDDQ